MKKNLVVFSFSLLFLLIPTVCQAVVAEQVQPNNEMGSAITVALIAACASVFGAVTSVISGIFINRYNAKKPISVNVLSEQYKKVFAPLHKILNFSPELSKEEKKEKVLECLTEQYALVPSELIQCYKKETEDLPKIEKNPKLKFEASFSFADLVEKCYETAKRKLGYTQTKVKYEAKIIKIIASPKKYQRWDVIQLILTTIAIIVCIITVVLSLQSLGKQITLFSEGAFGGAGASR